MQDKIETEEEFITEVERRYREKYGDGPETVHKRLVSYNLMKELTE